MILFPKEKIGVIFFIRKKTIRGGGVRGGVWQKTMKKAFFLALFPNYPVHSQDENMTDLSFNQNWSTKQRGAEINSPEIQNIKNPIQGDPQFMIYSE